jgi:tetratricopeptide (TPR) repeat protein
MNSNQKKIDGMISTFIWQLLQDSSDQRLLCDVRETLIRGPDTLELWASFKKVVIDAQRSPIYCVIDGVDECSEPSKDILENLQSLHDSNQFQFRIIIFGRPAGFVGIESPDIPSIEMNPSVVESDIERFIKRRVLESTALNSSDMGDRIINTLKEKSEGMLLWAKLMIDQLSRCGSTAEVRDGLQDLPRGLQDAYRQLLLRRINTCSKTEITRIRRILSIVTSTFRVLEIEELNHACAIDALSATIDGAPKIEEHLFSDTTRMITEVCGDFINVSNGFVQLVHFSLKEFLTRPEAEWVLPEDTRIACFHVDPDRCHLNLGMLCIDYMALNHYESPMQDENVYAENHRQYPFLGYAARHLLQHFISSAKPLLATLSKIDDFLKSKPCTLWIEYLLFFFGNDYAGIMEISDQMERIDKWILKIPRETSTNWMKSLVHTIQEEHSIRSSTFGNHGPRTQRWRSLVDMILSENTIAQELSIEKTQLQFSHPVSPLHELVHVLKSIDTSTVLARYWQIDTIIRLQSYVQRVNTLLDPLRIIFQLIMQKASAIPTLGLVAISRFYWRFDKFDESNQVLDAALKKIVDKEIPLKYLIYHLMGANYYGLKAYSNAERLCRQAFVRRSALRGLVHQDTIGSMYWVALCLHHQEKYVEAEALFRRSLELHQKVLGMDHSDTIHQLHWVAKCLYDQKKYADAEPLFQHSMDIRQKVLGLDHSETIWSMYWTARCLCSQKKCVEAEALFRRSLEHHQKVLGMDHSDTINCLGLLAVCLTERGRYAEAEVLFRIA